jgi:hypothetical protein
MPTLVSTRLNQVRVYDTFRVAAINQHSGLTYLFRAHGDISERIKMEFTCTLTVDPQHGEIPLAVVDTIATDGYGGERSIGTGRTLQELVHNMDWPHRPSELAELKHLLATRQFTNCKDLIGENVSRQLSSIQALRTRERIECCAKQLGLISGAYQALALEYPATAKQHELLVN